jgi:hypothetical protein
MRGFHAVLSERPDAISGVFGAIPNMPFMAARK